MKLTPLQIEDYRRYKHFFTAQRYELCSYSLASILAWKNEVYQPYGIVLDGALVIRAKFSDPQRMPYLILPTSPAGEFDPEALHRLAVRTGDSRYWFVPQAYLDRYGHERVAALFQVNPQPDYHDYVFRREDLAELKGNKYSKKRNLINQFEREYLAQDRVAVETLQPAAKAESLAFLERWCAARDCERNPTEDLACEKQAAVNTIENQELLEVSGILVRIDGEVSAFAIGTRLTADMGVLHFEKADADVKGLYQYLDRESARRLFAGCRYINKENDMGEEGIRQAKRSYYPQRMIRSHELTLR